MSDLYGVSVVFNERGYWSKGYTYLSNTPVAKDSVVVVETQTFFSIGKVTACAKDPVLKQGIQYKYIKQVLEI